VLTGYFNDVEAAVREIEKQNGTGGIYFTLNPVHEALLERSKNKLSYLTQATKDGDIEDLLTILINCDPVRPANTSSSDAEHDVAIQRARFIKGVLEKHGWTALILADSGNGAHLLVRTDLKNTPDNRQLVTDLLAGLDGQYSDNLVKVDVTTGNPARICRLYGTLNVKGGVGNISTRRGA
jgi:hypothetical protein